MSLTVSAIGKGERTFTATDAALEIHHHKSDSQESVAYADISKVQLLTMQGVFYTYVTGPSGKIRILSRSIRGPGRFEDLGAAYTKFVTDFHSKLGRASSGVEFRAGSSSLYIGGLLLVALGVVGIILRWGFGLRGTLPVVVSAAVGLPLVLLGRVKHYDPNRIPQHYLP